MFKTEEGHNVRLSLHNNNAFLTSTLLKDYVEMDPRWVLLKKFKKTVPIYFVKVLAFSRWFLSHIEYLRILDPNHYSNIEKWPVSSKWNTPFYKIVLLLIIFDWIN